MRGRKTAAEIIAFHLGYDFAEMSECRYQPTRFANPAVYACAGGYYAAPSSGKMPVGYAGLTWECVGRQYLRPIFRAVSA